MTRHGERRSGLFLLGLAAGATLELFRFTLTSPTGASPGVHPLTPINLSINGTNVDITSFTPGSIVVQGSGGVNPEPPSLAMVGIASVLGLGAVARRRLVRKAG